MSSPSPPRRATVALAAVPPHRLHCCCRPCYHCCWLLLSLLSSSLLCCHGSGHVLPLVIIVVPWWQWTCTSCPHHPVVAVATHIPLLLLSCRHTMAMHIPSSLWLSPPPLLLLSSLALCHHGSGQIRPLIIIITGLSWQ